VGRREWLAGLKEGDKVCISNHWGGKEVGVVTGRIPKEIGIHSKQYSHRAFLNSGRARQFNVSGLRIEPLTTEVEEAVLWVRAHDDIETLVHDLTGSQLQALAEELKKRFPFPLK